MDDAGQKDIKLLAAALGRGVLEVAEVLQKGKIPLDPRNDSFDADRAWKAFERSMRGASREQQAKATSPNTSPSDDTERVRDITEALRDGRNGPEPAPPIDFDLILELARRNPASFRRAREAMDQGSVKPEELREKLLLDVREHLMAIADELYADGDFSERYRRLLARDIEEASLGMVEVARDGRAGAVLMLSVREKDALPVLMLSYVAKSQNRFKQCSFLVNGIRQENAPRWIAFICREWQQTFLLRKEEVLERWGRNKPLLDEEEQESRTAGGRPPRDALSVSLRKDHDRSQLFGARVHELLEDVYNSRLRRSGEDK